MKPGVGAALLRSAACAGNEEREMEPKELLSISQGCGFTANNKTGFRGICSTTAKVNRLYFNLYIFFQTLHLGKSMVYLPN